MQSNIDLDSASEEIDRRRAPWAGSDLKAGPTTWRDQGRGWPPPIVENRLEVAEPDSVGVRITKAGDGSLDQYLEVVLYRGGWVDWLFHSGIVDEDPVVGGAGYDDSLSVRAFGDLLDEVVRHFR